MMVDAPIIESIYSRIEGKKKRHLMDEDDVKS